MGLATNCEKETTGCGLHQGSVFGNANQNSETQIFILKKNSFGKPVGYRLQNAEAGNQHVSMEHGKNNLRFRVQRLMFGVRGKCFRVEGPTRKSSWYQSAP